VQKRDRRDPQVAAEAFSPFSLPRGGNQHEPQAVPPIIVVAVNHLIEEVDQSTPLTLLARKATNLRGEITNQSPNQLRRSLPANIQGDTSEYRHRCQYLSMSIAHIFALYL